MSVITYANILQPPFLPIQCQRRPSDFRLTGDEFLREILRRIGVKSWLTTEEPWKIYHKVVVLGQSTHVECLVKFPSFVVKKLELQISIDYFALNIRLLSEQTLDWVDVREDPYRPGYKLCRWPKPLDPATTVINTDGSRSCDEKRAGIGCVFRMHQGEPLGGYANICDERMAIHVIETWGVREGLRITVAGDVKVVLIQADATAAVSMVNTIAAAYSNLVSKCRINYHNYLQESSRVPIRAASPRGDENFESYVRSVVRSHGKWTHGVQESSLEFLVKTLTEVVYFLETFHRWGCRYVMREANEAADFLAKLAEKEEIIFAKNASYPAKLSEIFEKDAAETWYQRVKPTPICNKCTKSTGWMLN